MEEVLKNVANLVVVGSWNRDIFTPKWVKDNILIGTEFEVLFPVNTLNSMKFVILEKYSFAISLNRLEFQLLNNSQEVSTEMLNVAISILRCLIHTPINSFGINFLYKTNERPGLLSSLQHTNEIKTELNNANIVRTEIVRTYNLDSKQTLNFKVSQEQENVTFDFNFSYNVDNIKMMMDIIDGNDNMINERRIIAKNLIENVYGSNE